MDSEVTVNSSDHLFFFSWFLHQWFQSLLDVGGRLLLFFLGGGFGGGNLGDLICTFCALSREISTNVPIVRLLFFPKKFIQLDECEFGGNILGQFDFSKVSIIMCRSILFLFDVCVFLERVFNLLWSNVRFWIGQLVSLGKLKDVKGRGNWTVHSSVFLDRCNWPHSTVSR